MVKTDRKDGIRKDGIDKKDWGERFGNENTDLQGSPAGI